MTNKTSKKKSTKKTSTDLSKKKPINGAKKGKQFERDVAIALGHIFPDAQRRLEYQASQVNGADLDNCGPYRIQCKRNAGYASVSKIKEVDKEKGFIPVLITKGNKMPAVAIMYFDDFIQQLEIIHGPAAPQVDAPIELTDAVRYLAAPVEVEEDLIEVESPYKENGIENFI